MPKQNILITGSQGFIGKNLIRELNKQDAVNIFEASRKNGLNLSEKNWTKNLPEHEIDVVIHLAQSSNYRNFPSKADDIFKINVASTFELLEWCRKRKIKKILSCLIRKCLWRSVQPSQRNKQNKSFFFLWSLKASCRKNISELPRVFSDNYFKNFHCFWARSKRYVNSKYH